MSEEPEDLETEELPDERKKHKEDKKKFQFAREEELLFMRNLVKTVQGRAFCWRVLSAAKMFTFGYVPESNLLYFDAGKRDLGSWLLQELLEAEPNVYTLMQNDIAIEAKKSKGAKNA